MVVANPRKKIRWSAVKGPKAASAVAIATAFGAGLFPFAPGTMGTAVAIPVMYFTTDWTALARAAMLVAFLIAGTWAAKVVDQTMGAADHSTIVIDEVIGYGITAWTVGRNPAAIIAAFFIFRFFDILKPPPVRQADQLSKNFMKKNPKSPIAPWVQGFGVMLDDVLAGFMGLAVLLILQAYFPEVFI